jgi:hypothetical protein
MPTPPIVDPVEYAWTRLHPRVPFPESLGAIARATNNGSFVAAPADPKKVARQREYQRDYQRKRRGSTPVNRSFNAAYTRKGRKMERAGAATLDAAGHTGGVGPPAHVAGP